MINLTTTSDIIRVITSAATAVHVQANWVDHTASAYTPGRTNTVIAAAATTTVIASPAASTQRSVKHLSICAIGGVNGVTVQFFDGATAYSYSTLALFAGDELQYTDTHGWRVMDGSGNEKVTVGTTTVTAPGGLLRRTLVTATASPFALLAATKSVRVRLQGGGGAGGGSVATGATTASAGTGGNAGGIVDFFAAQTTSFVFAIGAAGAPGAIGAAGGAGTATTATVGGVALSATGGPGGLPLAAASAATAIIQPPAAVTGTGVGAMLTEGKRGAPGEVFQTGAAAATAVAVGGRGGDGELGNGGPEVIDGTGVGGTAGLAGTGFGSGGSGAAGASATSPALSGGAGIGGWMLVEEFS